MEQTKLAITEKYAKLRREAEKAEIDDATAAKYTFDGPNGKSIDTRSGDTQIKSRNTDLAKQKEATIATLNGRVKAGEITEEEAKEIRKRIEYAFDKDNFNELNSSLDSTTKLFVDLGTTLADIGKMSWDNLADSIQNIGDIAQSAFAVMNAGLETYMQYSSAATDLEITKTEKMYERKMNLAQGNSYKEAKLEKEKEEKINKLKNEQTKKEYEAKVAQAIANTAQNAITAYGVGWSMGAAGPVLAPLYAGIATAAGLLQIAIIKKQQQAAQAANGYAEGGFTKPGGKYEPAGIVHAGEWVASQELLSSPVARPLIDALDYAQRTNTIGSLDADDVSRSITASDSLVRLAQQDSSSALTVAALSQNSAAVTALVSKLSEPFVTVNTVSGDKGIKKAQDEYEQLVRNKTPKSRRK
jgi:hypothetical protein